ncbi:methyltransferase domain-containing protein [Patescibacteria group bacterium]|nr:methyltransferase domain-containing protein [Patescibacteria group bacterium]MBU1962960.1 methyltransferase domain-containing protein [Patescibacteria group bacterium]
MKYLFILGNNPELSALELEMVFYKFMKNPLEFKLLGPKVVLIETGEKIDVKKIQDKLGGTVKIAEYLFETEELEEEKFVEILKKKKGKILYGFSLYPANEKIKVKKEHKNFEKFGLKIKKELGPARLVTSKDPELSSVIVQKEILKKDGSDFIVVIDDGKYTIGVTKIVQDFKTYSDLDYGRPARDPRNGMLPPKVAEMMINIVSPEPGNAIIDPFCGSGTILHAAAMLGWKNILGSDISPQAINNTKKNIEWLATQRKKELSTINFRFEIIDAQNLSTILSANSVDAIVTEVYLGPPKFERDLPRIKKDLETLYFKVFADFKRILKPKAKLVVAFPAWKFKKDVIKLDISKELKNLKYEFFAEPVIYGRPDAKVLREIYFLEN